MVCAVTSTQRNLAYVSDYRTGFGGTCLSGKCQSAGFLDTAKVCFPGFFGEVPLIDRVPAAGVVYTESPDIYSGHRCCRLGGYYISLVSHSK